MTKDVLVSISGLQTDALDESNVSGDAIEVITPASYFCKNGKHYILYDEAVEGVQGTIKNKIKISGENVVEIMKSGITNAHMVFERNKSNRTYYETPYGQMLVGVRTTDMNINVEEEKIHVDVAYELEINHEPLADCTITMNIQSKNADIRIF